MRLMASLSGQPGQASTKKVKAIWILMKQEMMGWQWHQLNHLHLTLLYDFLNIVINAFSLELLRAWFRRKEFINSAAAIGLCCMHKAPVRCLLGFLFYKQWISEVGKQSIF